MDTNLTELLIKDLKLLEILLKWANSNWIINIELIESLSKFPKFLEILLKYTTDNAIIEYYLIEILLENKQLLDVALNYPNNNWFIQYFRKLFSHNYWSREYNLHLIDNVFKNKPLLEFLLKYIFFIPKQSEYPMQICATTKINQAKQTNYRQLYLSKKSSKLDIGAKKKEGDVEIAKILQNPNSSLKFLHN